ncbi:hypothetical protein [Pseudomonas syringae]|uniref:hypothetical protein n=1 Tax=Pseudomonas syringae TaxID=317 RepID=UPI0008EDCCF8|nr:hypothetical protein [Pseudomonas syringae]SFO19272.1 hypothetical protein SAMN05444063_10289 [Pseudomonas syringae]
MTSLEIVELINKERESIGALTGKAQKVLTHDNFLKKVVAVIGEEGAVKFNGSYFSQQNKEMPMYVFPKREATLMAMSYSPAISAAVYDRMTELEKYSHCHLDENCPPPGETSHCLYYFKSGWQK